MTAEADGTPLSGIDVSVYCYITMYHIWVVVDSTYTGENGQYDFGDLDEGNYRVGFTDYSGTYINEYYDNAPDVESATDIPVTPGVLTPPVDAALVEPGNITGTVTAEADGAPLSSIEVILYACSPEFCYTKNETYTDENGRYDFRFLVMGKYRVGFIDYTRNYISEYYDNALDVESATDIPVTPGVFTPPVDAALAIGGRIGGTVTYEIIDDPLTGFYVNVYQYNSINQYWEAVAGGYPDSSGHYDIGGLAGGNYRVGFHNMSGNYVEEYYDNAPDVESATDIPVTPGVLTPPVNAALALAGHIGGTVTFQFTGEPLSNIYANAYRYNAANEYWEFVASAYTVYPGQYEISRLAGGSYRVLFVDYSGEYLDEYYDDVPVVESATDIVVTPGKVTSPINAALALAGHITGTVTAEDSGKPLKDVDVTAYRYDPEDEKWEDVKSYSSDFTGQYDIGGLPAASYRVGFTIGICGDEFYDNAPSVETGTDIPVTPGVLTPPVNAQLALCQRIYFPLSTG